MSRWSKQLGRLTRRALSERGSVLTITAILMVPILGFAAFAIDLGNWYQVRRQAQAAADAGALAGVQDLPGSPSTAQTDASTYGGKNISGASVTPTAPYNSDSGSIQVTVSKSVPSIFGAILGINSVTVTASAVAKKNGGTAPSAIFAADTSCSGQGANINGNNITVNGGTHSNGKMTLNGNNNNTGTTTYGGPNNCSGTFNGNNNSYGGGSPTVDHNNEPWPMDYSLPQNKPACTYSGSSFTWNNNNATIPSGVYCATGTIMVNGNSLSGSVTFIANSIMLNGNNLNFTPYANSLLLYQTGSGSLTVNGNNLNGGTVFAPTATIIVNGNNATTSGFIEGLDVLVNGNNFTITGTGAPINSGSSGSLIQ